MMLKRSLSAGGQTILRESNDERNKVEGHKKLTFISALIDKNGVMKINVYTTHDK